MSFKLSLPVFPIKGSIDKKRISASIFLNISILFFASEFSTVTPNQTFFGTSLFSK